MPAFTMFAILKFKPEHLDKVLEILKGPKGISVSKQAKGNLFFDFCVDADGSNTIRTFEQWKAREDWDAYMKLLDKDGQLVALHGIDFAAWLAEPPQFFPGASLSV
jgi:quinol monooxygenase YgiN